MEKKESCRSANKMLCLSYLLVLAAGMGQGMVVEVRLSPSCGSLCSVGAEGESRVGGLHDGEQEGVRVGS